jgi:hypothetical protein
VAQEIIGPYIADFCIYPSRVVVEVDGPSHRPIKQAEYDARRDTYMRNLGIKVLRFTNLEVESATEGIASRIVANCSGLELMSAQPTPIRIPEVVEQKWEPRKTENIYDRKRWPKGSKRRGSLSSASEICGACYTRKTSVTS